MSTLEEIREDVRQLADPGKAEALRRFFKTGPGQYGEEDLFLGVAVPKARDLARKHRELGLADTARLLRSPVHEERLLTLLILVLKFGKGGPEDRRRIYDRYLSLSRHVNSRASST